MPDDCEGKGSIDVDKEGGDFVLIVEDEAISPSNDGACQGAMRETVASDEEGWTRGKEPDKNEVENGDEVAEVKKEIVPGALFVLIETQRKKIATLEGVCDMDPSGARQCKS